MKFEHDLEALSRFGWGPDRLDDMARMGMEPGALATFLTLEPDTRALILRLLDSPTESDFAELDAHPAGRGLAEWLVTLPAYANSSYEDEEDSSGW
jgi:hypothetical protein